MNSGLTEFREWSGDFEWLSLDSCRRLLTASSCLMYLVSILACHITALSWIPGWSAGTACYAIFFSLSLFSMYCLSVAAWSSILTNWLSPANFLLFNNSILFKYWPSGQICNKLKLVLTDSFVQPGTVTCATELVSIYIPIRAWNICSNRITEKFFSFYPKFSFLRHKFVLPEQNKTKIFEPIMRKRVGLKIYLWNFRN